MRSTPKSPTPVHLLILSGRTRIRRDADLKPLIETLISTQAVHYKTPKNFLERHLDLFCDRPRDPWTPHVKDSILKANLFLIQEAFSKLPEGEWYPETLHEVLESVKAYIEQKDLVSERDKADKRLVSFAFYHYVRWALMGGRPGPRLADLMVYLGRNNTLRRLISAREETKGIMQRPVETEASQSEEQAAQGNIPH